MTDVSFAVPRPPNASERKYDFDELFPADFCRATIAELNAWTAVADVAAAARCLADAPGLSDQFDRRLILPFPDDDAFQSVVVKSIGWLIEAYRTPEAKIAMAALNEPALTPQRASELNSLKFRPSGTIGPPGAIANIASSLADRSDQRFLVLEDEPHIIEVVQMPLRCLMALIHKCAHDTKYVANAVMIPDDEHGSRPVVFHKPYADSALPAIVEALCFYAYGLDFGPFFAKPGEADLETNYRSTNVFGVPPIDSAFIKAVGEMNGRMLDDLR